MSLSHAISDGSPPRVTARPIAGIDRAALPAICLWCGFLLATPFYVLPRGQPQPADYLIVLLCVVQIAAGRFRVVPRAMPVLRAYGLLVLYMVLVNVVWSLLIGETGPLRYAVFKIFNLVTCLVCVAQFEWMGRRFWQCTGWTLLLSLALQSALALAGFSGGGTREVLFFENPNQLGYFAVLFCSLFWIWCRSRPAASRSLWVPLCGYGASFYLCALSMSRAALGALGAMLLLMCIQRPRLALIAGVAALGLAGFAAESEQFGRIHSRIERKARSIDSELSYRGYDRLANHPNYLLFGAGEGAWHRIDSLNPGELHSTLGTILFGYGLVGMALFFNLFTALARTSGAASLLFFVPALVYGMTHNGLRQQEFWLLFVLLACLGGTALMQSRSSLQPISAGELRNEFH